MQLTKQIHRTDIEPHMSVLKGWLRGNVVGIYAGVKKKNGKKTGEWSIVMHVQQKKSADRLALDKDTPIPPFIELPIAQRDGGTEMVKVPTDVQEVGLFSDDPDPLYTNPYERMRPCPGGYCVQPQGLNQRGTLGANITINGQYRMISCNHVLSVNGQYTQIYQPDTTNNLNFLCPVSGFEFMYTYPTNDVFDPMYNDTDLAWCNITPQDGAPNVAEIGTPVGFADPVVDEEVKYFGSFTGLNETNLASTTYLGIMKVFGNRYAWFQNMIVLTDNVQMAGDSGSVLINGQMQIVGMMCGGNMFRALACRIPLNVIQ
ncbi:hypothetical protein WJU16_21640 [Chitinophaga pollutisoli]|uniref:Trypsin-like peptidase domain-containing protein n=1 Tax=Chitinophaga pollutisoli TaxID=3133966 RepID=A0ABZ2YLD6_9BACT